MPTISTEELFGQETQPKKRIISTEELFGNQPDKTEMVETVTPERNVGFFGKVPISEYQAGKRNIVGNVFERPGAAVRGGIQNIGKPGGFSGGFQRASINPAEATTFQDLAVNRFTPRFDTGSHKANIALNTVGSLIPSAIGMGLDIVTNPADLATTIIPSAPGVKQLIKTAGTTQIARDISKIGNAPLKQLPKVVGEVVETAASKMRPGQVIKLDQQLNKVVKQGMTKGIRPSVYGKQTLKKADKFYKDASDAVKVIVLDKDEIGLPKSVGDLANAVDSTKGKIYKAYHETAVEAGEQGALFNPDNTISKLNAVSKDLKRSPEVRSYAQKLIPEIEELRGATPDIIEGRIAEYNKSLGGYYAGRTARTQAEIDASLANLMRGDLDGMIEKATGEQYSRLKKLYGSLKAIEKDVNNRATVLARQAPRNVFDLTDVFTGGQIIRGVLTANPADIAQGVTGIGIKNFLKRMNDPNRIVSNMFKKADKIVTKQSNISAKIPTALKGELVEKVPLNKQRLLPIKVPKVNGINGG